MTKKKKKERKKNSTVVDFIFCFEFNFVFLNWDISQFRLTTSVNCIVANGFCGFYLETPHKK